MQEPIGSLILLVFIGTYIAISSEKVNRAATSMTGMGIAGLVLWGFKYPFTQFVDNIEWGTILFLVSMMAIVAVAGRSGMFQYIALTLAKPTGGNTSRLFTVFIVFVFVISLVFDTTSTMLIMGPLTIEVCKALEIDFKPFLITEAITSNFASVPSIVGAVPNLVIAQSVYDAGASAFNGAILFITMMPISIILLIVTLFILQRVFEKELTDIHEDIVEQVYVVSPQHMIRSKTDFYLSLVAILILALAFTIGQGSGLEPPLVAIIVAFVLLLIARQKVENILSEINWNTIFFLIGIFGLVAALELVGFIEDVGLFVESIVAGSISAAVGFLVWIPAALSAVIDNIPVSIVLAPIAANLASSSPVFPAILIFAVNVGGYILPIGAPANILAMALAENQHDTIDFKMFAKIATPLALLHLLLGTGWLLLMAMIFRVPVA